MPVLTYFSVTQAGSLYSGRALNSAIESRLSVIRDGRLYYRGKDVLSLAVTCTLEQVAALLWAGDLEAALPEEPLPAPSSEWRALLLKYPDRFLIGSDTWINQRWLYYDNLMQGYRAWLGTLPPDVAKKIAWDNGARLFGLDEPSPR